MDKRALLIIGAQGSGKGTQSIKLTEHFAIPHISTGDLLRREIKNESSLGVKIKANLDAGELVPDEVIQEMIEMALNQDDVSRGFIFDGFPRNIAQADFFMNLMHERGYAVTVIYLHVSDEEAVVRMSSRGRADDTPELIQKRLAIFHAETKPLLEYFTNHTEADVLEIDGELSIDGVFEQIKFKLGEY